MISITFVFEAKGQETPEAQKAWTFSVYFENDLFTHTDKNYTKGWDNQLKNEPGLNIIYECKWRLIEARKTSIHSVQ